MFDPAPVEIYIYKVFYYYYMETPLLNSFSALFYNLLLGDSKYEIPYTKYDQISYYFTELEPRHQILQSLPTI